MLRRKQQFRTQVHQWKDALLFSFALWVAHRLWEPWHPKLFDLRTIEPFQDFIWLFLVIVPGAPLVLESVRFYDRPLNAPRFDTYLTLAKGCALVTMGLVIVLWVLKINLARVVIGLHGVVSFAMLVASEEILRAVFRTRYGQLQIKRRFIVVGTPGDVASLRADLTSTALDGMEIVAEVDIQQSRIPDLVREIHEKAPNGVILAAKHTYFGDIEAVIQACELEGVEVWLLADFFKPQISQTTLDDFRGRPVLVFRSAPDDSWPRLVKAGMDTVCAAIALVGLAIPFLLVALLIKLTSKGPVFFSQLRCGLNGQPFRMYKFRSMVTDAEQRKQELAKFNEMDGPVFKVTHDPRVTPLGRWLRKFSVDELPQIFNVLKGEMSLVGPRPLPVDEVKRFDDVAHRRRLSVKPGLTCLWQIKGRNNVTNFKEWVRLDLEYIDNWSLWLDLKIICMTVPVVLKGTGAK
ncbi:MAG TPA: exopolysaccharide biosynthesis polyprenyl glycosylphosphotransferase [Verrucomicrobiales bacterium]|nr:exopolysaccharide biosynthesis polyprenyl glycosylphosphotransferase [Verrucomicrobiales bacterium]